MACGEPGVVSSETTPLELPAATSTTLGSESGSTTTTALLGSTEKEFPTIELVEPVSDLESWDEFEFTVLGGMAAYRVTADWVNPEQELALQILSETAQGVSWHRVDAEGGEVGDAESIITPFGAWALSAGQWIELDPSDLDDLWALALGSWRLTELRAIYAQVFDVFPDLEPTAWIDVEGRDAVVYVGGPDAVAGFFGEQPGDVDSGQIEVWMDPAGFPWKVLTSASEVRDLSIPITFDWSLTDLGETFELELPPEIAAATPALPLLAWAETGSCGSNNSSNQRCETVSVVFGDGRWEIHTTGQELRTGTIEPSQVEPLKAALAAIDFTQLFDRVSNGECSDVWVDQETIVLFPTLPDAEAFASCTLPFDPGQTPYREAIELLAKLPTE